MDVVGSSMKGLNVNREHLSGEAKAHVDAVSEQGHTAWKAGNIQEAGDRFVEAWEAIPEPKEQFHQTQILGIRLITFFRQTHQSANALKWTLILQPFYPPGNISVEVWLGQAYFDVGDLDQAYVHFDRVYAQMKTRMFKGEDPKYLDFYMTRSGKKKTKA
jgi:hypothetical protein